MGSRQAWLPYGLFLTSLSVLLLELLDTRLLSVRTWYHISFMAVSLAMLGTAAGAVIVFLNLERLRRLGQARVLQALAVAFALSVPGTYLLLLRIKVPAMMALSWSHVLPLATTVVVLTVPFLLSGAAVTVGLTAMGGRIGILYGADLLGASAGCLLFIPLLSYLDIVSASFVVAAGATAGAACFARLRESGRPRRAAGAALLLLALGIGHAWRGAPLDIAGAFPEWFPIREWNAYSHVLAARPGMQPPFYWGKGITPDLPQLESSMMLIDGKAGTPLTRWDGDPGSLSWVQYDVTALPYHLRRHGDVAIIGVGGGRDVLAAIWAGSRSITGVEFNRIFVRILRKDFRDFAKLADDPRVHLVNQEGRVYLSRSRARFDVLQMSLVDTWASTGAGAYTLSENALYTVEAWRIFFDHLKPHGLLSTSRWFSPTNLSETSRLLTLCVTALLDRGVEDPASHVALITRGRVATLLASPRPLSPGDVDTLLDRARRYGFEVILAPGRSPGDERLARILSSRSPAQLRQAVADPHYDFSAPTDSRPYFFNMLKLASFYRLPELRHRDTAQGVIWGNLRATATLVVLLAVAVSLIVIIIFFPLVRSGLPDMSGGTFALSLGYFATIGYAFMAAQIPFLQRFSVFLGHPVYTYAVVLFTMICFSGIGSLLSDRIRIEWRAWVYAIPAGIATLLLALSLTIGPVAREAAGLGLPARCLIVVCAVSPVSVLLGMCFPLGSRMVERISGNAMPWMWGINGACGVFASILSVAVSVTAGINANLRVAAALYLLLALLASELRRRWKAGSGSGVPGHPMQRTG